MLIDPERAGFQNDPIVIAAGEEAKVSAAGFCKALIYAAITDHEGFFWQGVERSQADVQVLGVRLAGWQVLAGRNDLEKISQFGFLQDFLCKASWLVRA